ncbi:MAG: hypothetical protein GFH27_549293n134 [Chloroflexi bacterium AL-W]|nr:hypothetical protein [Chloroflexi bacterium AL-N1]NOK67751.1 hypothetical protein [Chloroflexi bacterium AL-N10]NOK75479.1 hypothetical protein [Chloroflexi bacterium AL-N5]NOK82267.1 hypothetical protein [Chloroflexi bacterium AL-W]NOK90112.1 hypothetical protein [Chloroflexi bacterium AL-N15]
MAGLWLSAYFNKPSAPIYSNVFAPLLALFFGCVGFMIVNLWTLKRPYISV